MRNIVNTVAVGLLAAALASAAVAEQMPEVTVRASRAVEKEVGKTSSGIPIVNVSLTYGVSYADLDLASHAGVVQLEKRVSDAAQEACSELRRQYPLDIPDSEDATCAKTSAGRAMVKVHELAAAAAKK